MRCGATTAGARTTWPCSRPGWSSSRARSSASPSHLPVDRRPTDEEIAALNAALPEQPRHVAVVLAGAREQAGWWGKGRPADWADAVEAARAVAREAGAELVVRGGQYGPWHPGRCAELVVVVDGAERVVGHAGELHPRVLKALGLPARTCAMELDLDALEQVGDGTPQAPSISTFPVATQDVALVVDKFVPHADVEAALREGAGELLEAIRLFDVYENAEQLGDGQEVAGVRVALPCGGPDADRGRGFGGPGRGGRPRGRAYGGGAAGLAPRGGDCRCWRLRVSWLVAQFPAPLRVSAVTSLDRVTSPQ